MADARVSFPTLEEWKAPWEKNGTEFDADTAKKLIYNMERNAATKAEEHRAKVEELQTEITTVKGDLETSKAKVNELEDAKITDAAERARVQTERELKEMRELLEKAITPQPAGQQTGTEQTGVTEVDKLKAAMRYGLSEEDAARLVGTTKEELDADAKKLGVRLGTVLDDTDSFGDDAYGQGGQGVRYDDGSEHGEMPSGVPARQGHRTNLGGAAAGRAKFDPAKEAGALFGR
jgi:hypothetical protein